MSEKKTKPKYSSVENVGWMIANAWRECRSVLLICVIIAVVSVALNLTELFIAPQILQRVENGAEVSSLLLTIVIFSGALFLLMGLKRYFEDNSLYGRIAVRTAIIVKINEKTNTTSYPNMLDSKIQKLRSKAYDATSGNSEASEHIWTTVTTLLTNLIGFVVYLTLLSNLSGLLMLVVIATTVISFFVSSSLMDIYPKKVHTLTYLKEAENTRISMRFKADIIRKGGIFDGF